MSDITDPLRQGPRPSTPDTTLEEFYQELQRAWRVANPQKFDRVTVIQELYLSGPVPLKIVFEVRADSPEEALGKILLAARREEIRIHA